MVDLPPHAYVPGQTARHPEDWFDAIKASVTESVPTTGLHDTAAFQAGLAYFHAGFFWECHEVLEAVWMHCPTGTPEREMTQAVIQLANARLKHVMGKPKAVSRLCDMVEAHLSKCPVEGEFMGLTVAEVSEWVAETRMSPE